MSQSSVIAGVFLAAFILWLAVNDRLKIYLDALWGPTAAPKPSGNPTIVVKNDTSTGSGGGGGLEVPGVSTPSGSSGGFSLDDILKTIPDLAAVAAG